MVNVQAKGLTEMTHPTPIDVMIHKHVPFLRKKNKYRVWNKTKLSGKSLLINISVSYESSPFV
jgi:hypothetical protein